MFSICPGFCIDLSSRQHLCFELTESIETWDGDAYLKIAGSRMTMVDESGNQWVWIMSRSLIALSMATSALIGGLPVSGVALKIGQMEVEVDRAVSSEE